MCFPSLFYRKPYWTFESSCSFCWVTQPVMPSRIARPNTLVIQVPEVLRSGSKDDFLAKLLEFLSPHAVLCVQFVPGYFV